LKFTPKAEKKSAKYFGSNMQALTFALPLKKGWQTTAKRSLKVRKQQHVPI